MVNLDLIIFSSAILGVIGIFIGILVAKRSKGRIKLSVIFLIISIIAFTLSRLINLLYFWEIINLTSLIDITDLATIKFAVFIKNLI